MTPETKMGSVESHFNVSLIVRDKVTGQPVSTNHDPFEEKREPKRNRGRGPSAYQPNALTLGQTGSQQNNEAACEIEEAILSCWPNVYVFPRVPNKAEVKIEQLQRNILTYTTTHKEQLKTQALSTHGGGEVEIHVLGCRLTY